MVLALKYHKYQILNLSLVLESILGIIELSQCNSEEEFLFFTRR